MKAKKNPPKILFFGTPDFAVETLKKILEKGYPVVAVVTSPDKPAGRGKKLRMPEVKRFALDKGLKVLQPANLKDPEFIEKLKSLSPDIAVVVAFRKLPREVWTIPPKGTFNVHASLLPDYRGAAPIHHAIINGEHKTGVTTFFINDKIDTGEILLQNEIPVADDDTFGSLYAKLKPAAAAIAIETIEKIEQNTIHPKAQDHSQAVHKAPKLTKENTRIDWKKSPREIYNFIRGLSPVPGAWTTYRHNGKEKRMHIYRANYSEEKHDFEPGTAILEGKSLKIAVPGGYILPVELKPENKKSMSVKDFINGLQNYKELYFN